MNPLVLIVVVVLIVVLLGGGYGYRAGWYVGQPYYGGGIGILGLVLIVVLLLLVFGRL